MFDLHTHFLPPRVMAKVREQFDSAGPLIGRPGPLHYRGDEAALVEELRGLGVRHFTALAYAHRPGMAAFLNDWTADFAGRVPEALHCGTFFPEPEVASYVAARLAAGVQVWKVHVQVGGFDPRDPLLRPAWGLLADAGVPVVVHCGNGPIPGPHTGLDVFGEVLIEHPALRVVLAHAGMPDYAGALDLLGRFEYVRLDTTMVGTPFSERIAPLPADWPARLVPVADRVVFGSDFPNIPYPYAEQVGAVARWAAADRRLGATFLRSVLYHTPTQLIDF